MTRGKTFIIAEMACSHEGQVQLAKDIIDGAGKAGADAVQLQIWAVASMMSPTRKEYEMLTNIELSQELWRQLVTYSRTNYPDMEVYAFVYEHKSIPFIDSLNVDGFKLNSSDLSNPLMLEAVAKTGKRINLSVGASTLMEIQNAVSQIKSVSESQITLMYGYQNFPTQNEDVHLNYMNKLKNMFELPVGYQDHSDADGQAAFWLPAAAMGMDCDVLEKHITHDRSFKGIDHESALNPDEFKTFVEMVRTIDQAKGNSTPRSFSVDEIKYRKFQKKSIVAARHLPENTVIASEDLIFLRADDLGYSPDQVEKLIGKVLLKQIEAYELIEEQDLR